MVITRKSIPRRTFLRGTGASPCPAGAGRHDAGLRRAEPARPIRLAFIEVPNGIMMDKWTPATEGADFALTPILEPLAPFRDRMLVLSGLDQNQSKALGVRDRRRSSARLHRLADGHARQDDLRRGLARRHLGRSDRGAGIRQIHPARLARGRPGVRRRWWAPASPPMAAPITTRSRGATRPRRCRWRTARAPSSSVCSATRGATDAKTRLALRQEDRSILDAVTDDVKRLRGKLGGADRGKIDQYLEAVRDVERRIAAGGERRAISDAAADGRARSASRRSSPITTS